MLRILLWKTSFEWAHLKRALWPRVDQKMYYFAFGANLNTDVLLRRRIQVYESFDYVLKNATLRFSQRGFYMDHGYASADATENEVVYGKMYLLLKSDADRMDHFEGVPFLRVHEKVFQKINDEDGTDFFYYRAMTPRDALKPTREYLDYLTTAYRTMPDVPKPYTDSLAQTEVLNQFLPQNQTGEFVRNIDRWPTFLHPILISYEGYCLRLVEFLWNRSVFNWLINKQQH